MDESSVTNQEQTTEREIHRIISVADKGIKLNFEVYTMIERAIENNDLPDASTLNSWKSMIRKSNRAMFSATQQFIRSDNRHIIEKEISKIHFKRDTLDILANHANVYDRIRTHSKTIDIDRALTAATHVNNMVETLAPIACFDYNGAPLLEIDIKTGHDGLAHLGPE
tara:strand:- start:179 stop:682 length:504 start_codon:yes stop_codon:yes gene_type:complete